MNIPEEYIEHLIKLTKDITDKYKPEDIDEELSYLLGYIISLESLIKKI